MLIAQRWAEGHSHGFEIVSEQCKQYGLSLPEIKNLPSGLVQVIIQRPEPNSAQIVHGDNYNATLIRPITLTSMLSKTPWYPISIVLLVVMLIVGIFSSPGSATAKVPPLINLFPHSH